MGKLENDAFDRKVISGSDNLKISQRTGCALVLLFGVILFVMIWIALSLGIRGEINLQNNDLVGLRVWRISSESDQGLALSRSQRVSEENGSHDLCVKTTVRFLLWRSSAPQLPQAFCECYQGSTGQWQYTGACNP